MYLLTGAPIDTCDDAAHDRTSSKIRVAGHDIETASHNCGPHTGGEGVHCRIGNFTRPDACVARAALEIPVRGGAASSAGHLARIRSGRWGKVNWAAVFRVGAVFRIGERQVGPA